MANDSLTVALTGHTNEKDVVLDDNGDVQGAHTTDVITDPEGEDAVQTPVAQQTGGLDQQSAPSAEDTFADA